MKRIMREMEHMKYALAMRNGSRWTSGTCPTRHNYNGQCGCQWLAPKALVITIHAEAGTRLGWIRVSTGPWQLVGGLNASSHQFPGSSGNADPIWSCSRLPLPTSGCLIITYAPSGFTLSSRHDRIQCLRRIRGAQLGILIS